jgi:hypothetical protein
MAAWPAVKISIFPPGHQPKKNTTTDVDVHYCSNVHSGNFCVAKLLLLFRDIFSTTKLVAGRLFTSQIIINFLLSKYEAKHEILLLKLHCVNGGVL